MTTIANIANNGVTDNREGSHTLDQSSTMPKVVPEIPRSGTIFESSSPVSVMASPTLMVNDDHNSSDNEKNKTWKQIHTEFLDEIVAHAHIKKHYKMSAPRRIWNVVSTALCCSTVCSPCLAWDCVCCTLSLCCKSNPCRWGIAFESVGRLCEDTFVDTRMEKLKNIKSKDITCQSMQSICAAYLSAFDAQLALKTVEGAKRANIIREKLVRIISIYGPGFKYALMKDDGNIDNLRQTINELPAEYAKYTRLGLL